MTRVRHIRDLSATVETRWTLRPESAIPAAVLSTNGLAYVVGSATGVTNHYAYDALERRIAEMDGRGNTVRTAYDALGRVSSVTDAAGFATTFAYDALGRQVASTDPLGNVTHTSYDAEGRVVARWGATYPVLYAYDAFGDLATLTTFRDAAAPLSPERGDTTRWLRDAATGLVTNKLYADGLGPSYTYTPDGKLATRTWARGVVTEYSYDGNGSLTNVVYSDGTPSIAYAYDNRGNLLSAVVEGVSTNIYAYDVFGNLTNEVQNGATIARTYDAFGRPTGYALGGFAPSREVYYAYDTLGRFASVTAGTSIFTYARLPGSDLVSGYASGGFIRSVAYEPNRNLISAVTNAFGSALISAFDYANDPAGRRMSRLDIFDGTVTTNLFGYNTRSEVTSALMGTNTYGYAYDPIGNRIEASHNAETNSYTANNLNQYTSIDTAEPTYDADGNMTSDGRGWHYAWNGENRMVMASNDAVVVTYAYDHRGRMVRKNVVRSNYPTNQLSNYQTNYTWDNWNIIRETVFTNSFCILHSAFCIDYVWGLDIDGTLQGAGGVGGLLAVIKSDAVSTNSSLFTRHASLYFPAYDANGNITEYVDASDGEVIAHYNYSPFGEQLVVSGPLVSMFTHRFSTKPWCSDADLLAYQMRRYRPDIGRWLSRDPILEHSSYVLWDEDIESVSFDLNNLAFCGNSPVNLADRLGLGASVVNNSSEQILLIVNIDLSSECKKWLKETYPPLNLDEGINGVPYLLAKGDSSTIDPLVVDVDGFWSTHEPGTGGEGRKIGDWSPKSIKDSNMKSKGRRCKDGSFAKEFLGGKTLNDWVEIVLNTDYRRMITAGVRLCGCTKGDLDNLEHAIIKGRNAIATFSDAK